MAPHRCLLSLALLRTAAALAPVAKPRTSIRMNGIFDSILAGFTNAF